MKWRFFANDDADENIPTCDTLSTIASTLPRGGGHTPSYLPFGEETMRTNAQRILIAECHRLVAEVLKQILETDYHVVATVSDGRAMVRDCA